MTWFKVDDKLHDHRKTRAAGATAMGVWVLAGSWSADNLTDGFIPASLLPRWGRQREANKLVEVGLWHADSQDGEDGWRFHEWDERQPTRAQKEAERAAKSEAGRSGGLKSGQSRREAKTKQSASPLVELPSRPDPTLIKESEIDHSSEAFERFWNTYGKKVKRADAEKKWAKAIKKADPDRIIAAAAAYVAHERATNEGGKYIADPSTWLYGERWADETAAPATLAEQPTRRKVAHQCNNPTAHEQHTWEQGPNLFWCQG